MEFIAFLNIAIVALMVSGIKGIANYFSFACLLLMLWIGEKHSVLTIKQPIKCFVFFIIYYILTSMVNLDAEYFAIYTSYHILAFSPVFVYIILSNIDKKYSRFTLRWSILIWGFMTVYSIYFYLMNPMAARESAADTDMFSGELFGGYFFAYGSAILCVYCFSLLFDARMKKNVKVRRGLLIAVILLIIAIFMTNSTITTFATILGICFTLVFGRILKRNDSEIKKIVKISIAFIAVFAGYLLLLVNIDNILSWLSERSDVLFFKRLEELINGLFFDNTTTHYEKREDTLIASIQIFSESPIFGVGYRFGNVFSAGKDYGIGGHSELLDSLARYGMIGAIPLIGTYFYSIKDYCKRHLGVLLTFILLVVFNPFISYQSNLIIFLVIPLCENILNRQAENTDESLKGLQQL